MRDAKDISKELEMLKSWDERRMLMAKLEMQNEEIRRQILLEDLEFAKLRKEKMAFERRFWQSEAARPGEHDALFRKMLTEVELMRQSIENQNAPEE